MRLPDGHAYLLRTAINVSSTYGYDLELIRSFKTIHEQLSSPKDFCARALLCVQKPFPQTHLSNALSLINGNTLYSLLLSLYLIKSVLILEETEVEQSFNPPSFLGPPKRNTFIYFIASVAKVHHPCWSPSQAFLVSSRNAPPGGALRDETKNACEGDYILLTIYSVALSPASIAFAKSLDHGTTLDFSRILRSLALKSLKGRSDRDWP